MNGVQQMQVTKAAAGSKGRSQAGNLAIANMEWYNW